MVEKHTKSIFFEKKQREGLVDIVGSTTFALANET